MTEYVLSFAFPVRRDPANHVVVVERRKADWQQGRLNLPGGRLEPGETPEQAACRELREETSLVASLPDTRLVGNIMGTKSLVHVCLCPYRDVHGGETQEAKVCSPVDGVLSVPWSELMHDLRLIPNLLVIVPLCQSRVAGWSITDDCGGSHKFNVTFERGGYVI